MIGKIAIMALARDLRLFYNIASRVPYERVSPANRPVPYGQQPRLFFFFFCKLVFAATGAGNGRREALKIE